MGFTSPSNLVGQEGGRDQAEERPPAGFRIKATCVLLQLSSDDSHHTQARRPYKPHDQLADVPQARRWNQVVRNVVEAIANVVGTISQPAVVRG